MKNTYHNASSYLNYRISSLIHHKFSSRHSYRGGLIASSLGSDIYIVTNNDYPENRAVYVDYKGRSGALQAYLQHQFQLSGNVEINSGLHGLLFLLNSKYALEPRVGIKWNFSPNQTLAAGSGLHSRHEPISMYTAFYTTLDGSKGTRLFQMGCRCQLQAQQNRLFLDRFYGCSKYYGQEEYLPE